MLARFDVVLAGFDADTANTALVLVNLAPGFAWFFPDKKRLYLAHAGASVGTEIICAGTLYILGQALINRVVLSRKKW